MTDKATIFYNNKKAGLLLKREDGYEFEYDSTYMNDPDSKPISLIMPLSQKRFFSEREMVICIEKLVTYLKSKKFRS